MKNIVTAFAGNRVFANIIMLIILLGGIMSSNMMIRESMPSMELDKIKITMSYPGADPEEVEEGISRKIEDAIEGLSGIDSVRAVSSEGISSVTIEVKDGYDPEELVNRIRNEVDGVTTFPDDAETASVVTIEIQDAVMTLALTSPMSERRIKEWAREVKDEIAALSGISRVEVLGTRAYEITAEVSRENLRKYGLSISDVGDAVRKSSLNKSGGLVKTGTQEIRVRTVGRKYTGEELLSVAVVAGDDGSRVTLGDIAEVRDGFTENSLKMKVNGNPAVLLNIFSVGEDTIDVADRVRSYARDQNTILPEGSYISVMSDNTDEIRSGLSNLVDNAMVGLVLVFILLWLFMNTRISFWAGMGIPISIMGGVAVINMMGQTLNNITLFGLIMVLGIVADDAIIVGEAIFVHRQKGKSPMDAVKAGISEVGMPVIAAVLTTMVAFVPLFNLGGTMGKFIIALPMAVVACLAISLLECLVLLPAHLSDLPGPHEVKTPGTRIGRFITRFHEASMGSMDWFSEKIYKPALNYSVRHRYPALCLSISLLLLTMGAVSGGIVKFDVFPPKASSMVLASVTFPEGTPFKVMEKAVDKVERGINLAAEDFRTKNGRPIVVSTLASYGQAAGDGEKGSGSGSSHVGGVRVTLLDPDESGVHSRDVLVAWQKHTGEIPGVQSLKFSAPKGGKPGSPVEICLKGNDLGRLKTASRMTIDQLKTVKGVTQVTTDQVPGKNELIFTLTPQAEALGITVSDLASQVYAGYYGDEAVRVQRGEDDVKVRIILPEQERKNIDDLADFRIKTSSGHEVPLSVVAEVKLGPGFSSITRQDGLRQIKVSADLDSSQVVAQEVTDLLAAGFFKDLKSKFPEISISLEGDAERSRESFGGLVIWVPIAILGVYMIVATMFRSYAQPVIIMFTIPFGLIGAVFGHLVMGHMLSLLSVFGMVALTGVVVNDAIVLIERVNMNLEEGMPFFEAVISGGTRRFRAVMLTSLSTVGGLLPLMLEKSQQAQMLVPMSISLAFGVAFATFLTLVLIPCLFVILSDLRVWVKEVRHERAFSREEAEPASLRNRHLLEEIPAGKTMPVKKEISQVL